MSAHTIAEWDWVYTPAGRRLHHAATIEDPAEFEREATSNGLTTCGVEATLMIPGIMSRLAMPRCKPCCDRLGIPAGTGSPKNDPELRPWVEARLANPHPTDPR